jgi:uncharacterized protein (DUF305 family)
MPGTHPIRRKSAKTAAPARFGIALATLLLAAPAATLCAQQPAAPIIQPGPPGAPSKPLPPSTTGTVPALSHDDVEFMQGMIMHHQQAVEMTALIPTHTTNPAVISIGKRINLSQSDEIKFMRKWLESRGQSTDMAGTMPGMPNMDMSGHDMPLMPGMLSPQQMEALRNAHGPEFDRLFLTGMIQHHGGALVMVKDLFNSAGAGQDADLFQFATDVDNGQRAEIRIMQNMLKNLPKDSQ